MPQDVLIRVDGAPGERAVDGAPGSDGGFGGSNGGRGGDASPARRGQDAGKISLRLRSSASDPRCSPDVVVFQGRAEGGVQGVNPQVTEGPLTWAELGEVVVSARGGRGGDGGRGGRGGDGGRGRSGRDATRSSSGGDGGPGGNGGDGGYGSDGADGGHGGAIRLEMAAADTYLLMAVRGADAPLPLVERGHGGSVGAHGGGGSGGAGGSGGSSYRWTETESYRDSQGKSQTRSVSRSNPGGSSGRRGYSGAMPTSPLHPGQDGLDGLFEVHVRADSQLEVYPARYDLTHERFAFREADGPDVDGVFEFGEWVVVYGFVVRNVGAMPTPPMQRVRVIVGASQWIAPADEELFIARSLAPGEAAQVEGALRFKIPRPQIIDPAAPLIAHDQVAPQAWQLGVERAGARADQTPFMRRYQAFSLTLPLVARFPLQNSDGVRVLRSLAAGERSKLVFAVENVSQKDIGRDTARGRRVWAQVERWGGELTPQQLVFLGADGARCDLGSAQPPAEVQAHEAQARPHSRGYWIELPCVPAGQTVLVEGEVGFEADVEPYTSAGVRCTIWLESMARDGSLEVVQRREATLRVEPGYARTPDARFLLVTHNNVSRDGYKAWRHLFQDQVPLAADDWSISRYGHLDHEAVLYDGMNLRAHLEDRVVVVLNAPFNPRDDASTELPTNYIRGSDFRESVTTNNTAFVILGADGFRFEQWLEPNSTARMGGDDFPDVARFMTKERGTGGSLMQDILREDITAFFDRVTVEGWALPVLRPKDKALLRVVKKLARALADLYPNRRYVLIYHPEPAPVPLPRLLGIIPRYRFGVIEVRRSIDRDRSDAVLVACDPRAVNDPSFIQSDLSRLALLLALSFDHKLDLLNHFLRLKPDLSPKLESTLKLLIEAMLVDLAEEQAALRRAGNPLSDEVFKERLSYLDRLRQHPFIQVPPMRSPQWSALITLSAGLTSLAREPLWWWQLWGRQRAISRHILDVTRLLRSELFEKQAIDAQGDTTATLDQIDAAIAKVCTANHDLVARVRAAYPFWTRIKLHRAAALACFLHPAGDKITREAECWIDPLSRVWSTHELERAIHDEQHRLSVQAALRQHNADTRARMLTASTDADAADAFEGEQAQAEEVEVEVKARRAAQDTR